MTTRTRIKKWGNSFGIVIPKTTLAQLNVAQPEGQELSLRVLNGKLVIEPQRLPTSIAELFADYEVKKHTHTHHDANQEIDFGTAQGHEFW